METKRGAQTKERMNEHMKEISIVKTTQSCLETRCSRHHPPPDRPEQRQPVAAEVAAVEAAATLAEDGTPSPNLTGLVQMRSHQSVVDEASVQEAHARGGAVNVHGARQGDVVCGAAKEGDVCDDDVRAAIELKGGPSHIGSTTHRHSVAHALDGESSLLTTDWF